ncbi:MAG TPA: response regulator [bacterium]|nr:response regulator [bacterium]
MNTLKNKTRILVCEDDADLNKTISEVLLSEGFDTMPAFDGEQCLNIAVAENPDLIVLDLILPKIEGLEVCRRLNSDSKTKTIPVIILTGKNELSTKLSSFVAGAKRFLTKPLDAKELVSEINRTLRQREISIHEDTKIDPRD